MTTPAAANTAQPIAPTKPDFRTGLVLFITTSVATGMIQTPVGSALLAAWPILLGALLGSWRLAWQLTGAYAALRILHYLSVLGAHLPLVPWLGILLTMSVYGFPVLAMGLVIFTRVPMGEVMAALDKLRLPGTFLVVIMVIYRYLPTLIGELRIIRSAARLRSSEAAWRRWLRRPLAEVEHAVVPVLMRSGRIADELSAVAECKGLDPRHRRSSMTVPRLEPIDWGLMVLTAAVVAAIKLWGNQ
ncbi:MAG: energy-coupling factor transporter transmembrane component T [Propionibacteriaceae bacterium]|nr:energy-coupling factor transporter transmembrane component T [Propionibacteriaceae bacterium]